MESIKFTGTITNYKVKEKTTEVKEVIIPTDIQLPDDSPARVKVLSAEKRKWYLTIVYHEATNHPFALFCKTNSQEGSAQTSDAIERLFKLARSKGIAKRHVDSTISKCTNEPNVGKLTRAISLLLRHGVLVKNVVKCLDGMDDIFVGSFLFQLKKFLSYYIKDGEVVEGMTCTAEDCGAALTYSEGCMVCTGCGTSKCQ